MANDPIDDRIWSLEETLAELIAKYRKKPSQKLGRMIRQLEIEIAEQKGIRHGTSLRPSLVPGTRLFEGCRMLGYVITAILLIMTVAAVVLLWR